MNNSRLKMLTVLLVIFFSDLVNGSWKVDCGTHCFFSEFENNCQGVFFHYDEGKSTQLKSYATWNDDLQGCFEKQPTTFTSHLLKMEQIPCACRKPFIVPPKALGLSKETRKKLEFLRAAVRNWIQCAPKPSINIVDKFRPFDWTHVSPCKSFRNNGADGTYFPPGVCLSGLFPWHLATVNQCNFNADQNANLASECLSGERWLCDQIKAAQHPDTGAWFRNPFMMLYPETALFQPAFSRDQLIGSLAYWIISRDKNSLLKWLRFVRQNGKTAPWAGQYLFNLCPSRPNIPKPSHISWTDWNQQLPDDRCAVLNVTWGQIYMVAKRIGITDSELANISGEIHELMLAGDLLLETYLLAESLTVPVTGTMSFMANNTFKMLKLARLSGRDSPKIQRAFYNLSARTSDLHPGYLFYAEGGATERGAYLINKYCPVPRPVWGGKFYDGYQNINNGSIAIFEGVGVFERNYQFLGGADPYGYYNSPSGYDCIEMINLYLGNSVRHSLKCFGNDPLINNACQRIAFVRPVLAKIHGIGYEFSPWDGKVRYKAVDHKECPFGGYLGDGPFTKQCFFKTPLETKNLLKDVTYEVDVSSEAPGIYYRPKNGNCQKNEKMVGSRCQLIFYAPSLLESDTTYNLVSTGDDYSVTYASEGGRCIKGGIFRDGRCEVVTFKNNQFPFKANYFIRKNPSHPGIYYYPEVVVEKTYFERFK